ncbi:MAG TPA: PIG-L family deacetylase, partial [Kiritimatiellae bacterium]|nr:PIG-L family deacetylase [Kiritimatiellia bacterium]
MRFSKATADVFIPDDSPLDEALDRVTHLGIAAHPDDLELMALHGILHCLETPDDWFGAVISTGGGGGPEAGRYRTEPEARLKEIRRREQNLAGLIGRYSVVIHLDFDSRELLGGEGRALLAADITRIAAA